MSMSRQFTGPCQDNLQVHVRTIYRFTTQTTCKSVTKDQTCPTQRQLAGLSHRQLTSPWQYNSQVWDKKTIKSITRQLPGPWKDNFQVHDKTTCRSMTTDQQVHDMTTFRSIRRQLTGPSQGNWQVNDKKTNRSTTWQLADQWQMKKQLQVHDKTTYSSITRQLAGP